MKVPPCGTIMVTSLFSVFTWNIKVSFYNGKKEIDDLSSSPIPKRGRGWRWTDWTFSSVWSTRGTTKLWGPCGSM